MFSSTSAPMLGATTMGHIGGSSAWNRQDYQAGYMRRSRAERRSKASERRAIRRAERPEAMVFEMECEGGSEPADLAFESAIDRFGTEQGWSSDVGYFDDRDDSGEGEADFFRQITQPQWIRLSLVLRSVAECFDDEMTLALRA